MEEIQKWFYTKLNIYKSVIPMSILKMTKVGDKYLKSWILERVVSRASFERTLDAKIV